MNGFSIFMFIFAGLIFIAGLILFTGHKDEVLLWKVQDIKNFPMEKVKEIGKWTMISSLIPLVIAILGVIFNIG